MILSKIDDMVYVHPQGRFKGRIISY